ncbi:mismatch-specific DNA-glycosylase [Salana multivorans]
MGFTREELLSFTGAEVPDLVGPNMRLLLAGINPGLHSAAVGAHFARRGNRFWPALAAAGVLPYVVDAHDGMKPEDERLLVERGIGISNIGRRATARADQLTATELRAGADQLRGKVRGWAPDVVAILGLTAYRTAFNAPRAVQGEQPDRLEGARLWVLPSPSGLNAHETLASLATAYAEPARAAGLLEPLE